MTNIFAEDTIYIELAELTASTRNTLVKALSEEDKNVLITKSEIIIDDIIGEYGEKVVSNQPRIFPTINDDIPIGIKKATVLLCTELYEDGVLDGSTSSSTKASAIKSEKYGDHAITYQDADQVSSTRFKLNDKYITDEIYMYLKPYLGSNSDSASGTKNTWVIIG